MRSSVIAIVLTLTLGACATQAEYTDPADSLCRDKQLQPGSSEFAACVAEHKSAPAKREGVRYCRRGVFCQKL